MNKRTYMRVEGLLGPILETDIVVLLFLILTIVLLLFEKYSLSAIIFVFMVFRIYTDIKLAQKSKNTKVKQ